MCRAQQMSGRSLRRLPILAHMNCVKLAPIRLSRTPAKSLMPSTAAIEPMSWLDALEKIVAQQAIQKTHFGSSKLLP
jgi:pachytene checkpoint protein 2